MISLDGKAMYSKYSHVLLNTEETGEILLVTSKGVYFSLNNHIFQLTLSEFGYTPIGIHIENIDFLTSVNWKVGQQVCLRNGVLHLSDCRVNLEIQKANLESHAFHFLPSQINDCAVSLAALQKANGVSTLCSALVYPGEEPATFANALCQNAYPLLGNLIDAIKTGTITNALQPLIGLGIGLTPSLDDVILGMLYTFIRAIPHSQITQELQSAVITLSTDRTNAISAAYLQAVAENAAFERLDDLLLGLSGQIPMNLEPILQIGNSSGSEMLLGVLIAAKIITDEVSLCNILN